ncbi:hypothetical protein M0813_09891 [Anaeramoeba flamelloides]|uniref:Calcineurin-like phosphoesterase domain-containing protein n=1 Tax=Anaeramoeba flamelloides TaxID=1746091 RepID=A0ABQ8X4N7_9EUKA|nr:hypothetical protein M0813_09891 [Anaeramoeba flamelloides]
MLPLTTIGGRIVDLKCESKWNAIVITDLHFSAGESYFSKELIPQTFEELGQYIEKEQSKQIIILGDVFHSQSYKSKYHVKIIEDFLQFGLPVYIIPGNHDRTKFLTIEKKLSKKQLSMCTIVNKGFFMRITPNIQEEQEEEENEKKEEEEEEQQDLSNCKNVIDLSTFDQIIFTHDAGNGYWLSEKQVIPFLRSIKFHHKQYFDESSGHTHRLKIAKDEQFGSLSPFHPGSTDGRSYAVVKQVGNKLHLYIVKI